MNEKHAKILIGTSGWTYDDWKGPFYPEKMPRSKWLEYYTGQFSTVEVNSTFYRPFTDQTYQNWSNSVPPDFLYVLKAPRIITHQKYLEEVDELIRTFWRSASLLGERLGMILLQVAPGTPYDLDRLRSAILSFGDPKKIAVEFRDDIWYSAETRAVLSELGAAFCCVDSPLNQLVDWVTSDTAYIRLHGRINWYAHDYNEEELRQIKETADRMAENGAKTIYIFFNNDYQCHAPRNAHALEILFGLETRTPPVPDA